MGHVLKCEIILIHFFLLKHDSGNKDFKAGLWYDQYVVTFPLSVCAEVIALILMYFA